MGKGVGEIKVMDMETGLAQLNLGYFWKIWVHYKCLSFVFGLMLSGCPVLVWYQVDFSAVGCCIFHLP